MTQTIDKKALHDFLKKHTWGVLSTVNAQGLPDAAPVYYVVDEALNCFFLTAVESEKSRNIDVQNRVVFTVTDEEDKVTVQLKGKVKKEPGRLGWFIPALAAHLNADVGFVTSLPVLQHKGEKTVLVLTPTQARMRRYFHDHMEEGVVRG